MTQSLDIKPAQIKDVIDPRFTIIGDDKKPITQDYTVTKNGTTYNTETGIPTEELFITENLSRKMRMAT